MDSPGGKNAEIRQLRRAELINCLRGSNVPLDKGRFTSPTVSWRVTSDAQSPGPSQPEHQPLDAALPGAGGGARHPALL